ncbi:hypothetical protein BDV98DRAFT_586169 [Pterulicium gracile]|uniref:Uncharacterized protein n=1 Tax=Pterulicium gracile TaxID=1884261 RepID=A0A5C3Q8K2_9AGAR|nr:hypothetical protein BDV98DRAFT_586169 [Pterula gracilis]
MSDDCNAGGHPRAIVGLGTDASGQKKLVPPGVEPGTFCVTLCDIESHYRSVRQEVITRSARCATFFLTSLARGRMKKASRLRSSKREYKQVTAISRNWRVGLSHLTRTIHPEVHTVEREKGPFQWEAKDQSLCQHNGSGCAQWSRPCDSTMNTTQSKKDTYTTTRRYYRNCFVFTLVVLRPIKKVMLTLAQKCVEMTVRDRSERWWRLQEAIRLKEMSSRDLVEGKALDISFHSDELQAHDEHLAATIDHRTLDWATKPIGWDSTSLTRNELCDSRMAQSHSLHMQTHSLPPTHTHPPPTSAPSNHPLTRGNASFPHPHPSSVVSHIIQPGHGDHAGSQLPAVSVTLPAPVGQAALSSSHAVRGPTAIPFAVPRAHPPGQLPTPAARLPIGRNEAASTSQTIFPANVSSVANVSTPASAVSLGNGVKLPVMASDLDFTAQISGSTVATKPLSDLDDLVGNEEDEEQ